MGGPKEKRDKGKGGTMMQRIWPRARGFMAALILAALAIPATAETPSKVCLAAIKAANAHHKADSVADDCWRMGPLRLGMTLVQARTLLGAPGMNQALAVSYHRRKFPITRLFYVYPRNQKNWLRLAPARRTDFHPITLRLDFSKDALVAVRVDSSPHIVPPPCRPSAPGHGFVHKQADFPYGFHGLTLDAPLGGVTSRFGRFASSDKAKNISNYWPVPLSIEGTNNVSAIEIATGMAFTGGGGMPDFQLQLDPRSCFVTGYVLAPGH
jgi:hypothetical protein